MGKKSTAILPQTKDILEKMGEQIKLARLRRGLSAEAVARQAGISRTTMCSVEKGSPSVAIGIYASVLHVMNEMDRDLLYIAREDEFGRKLQDLSLLAGKKRGQTAFVSKIIRRTGQIRLHFNKKLL